MRGSISAFRSGFASAVLLSLGVLAACSSDLFHATDWASACDNDPTATGCPDAEPKASTAVSAPSSGAATTGASTASAGGAGGQGGQGGEAASGGGGGAGGASECATAADSCATCEECAINGPCASEAAACENNPECALLLDCYLNCAPGNQMCTDQCLTLFSGGVGEASAYYTCVECVECAPLMCDAAMFCG